MTLLDEIVSKVDAGVRAGKDSTAIAAALSEGRTRAKKTAIGAGTILDLLGLDAGNAFLDIVDSQPAYKWAKTVLFRGEFDLSASTAQTAVIGMQQAGVLTQVQADSLLALATESAPVSEEQVRRAIWADNGDYLA